LPILSCTNVNLSFGDDLILDGVNLSIDRGEHICLTGRNGMGKSTLLKVFAGDIPPDAGSLWRDDNAVVATLSQTLIPASEATVYDAVGSAFAGAGRLLAEYYDAVEHGRLSDLDELHSKLDAIDGWTVDHRIRSAISKLDLVAEDSLQTLSGGWRRRVGIARSIAVDPDIWLLDEPTNHLDIATVAWFESVLQEFEGAIVLVSHDRALMHQIAASVIDIDRGAVKHWRCGYGNFLLRKEQERDAEAHQWRAEDVRLKQEEVWIRKGIKARRTRNEGRVHALEDMRAERARRRGHRALSLEIDAGAESGKRVLELIGVSKRYGDKLLLDDIDLLIRRGDRIGIVGPNGCGKSTLLKILLEGESPDDGQIRRGTRLDVAYFDQMRDQLDPEQSVADCIGSGQDFIDINGKSTHVTAYLRNFMFTKDQIRAPIRVLSGGETNRLLLARLFALPANLLVLDEPTNDLDVESLELLEELLIDYSGTVLLVTHDRAFLDNVISSLLVFEGEGKVTEYVGGFSDWECGGGQFVATEAQAAAKSVPANRRRTNRDARRVEKERLALPAEIEQLEGRLTALDKGLADPEFYRAEVDVQTQAQQQRRELVVRIATLYERWEELEAD